MLFRFLFTILSGIVLFSAAAPASAGEPIRLTPGAREHSLHANFSVLPDVNARWTIDDFPTFQDVPSGLAQTGTDFGSIPLEISRYWLTFDVVNQTEIDEWVLFIPMHLINSVELIAVDANGTRQYARSGEDLAPYKRPFNDFGNSLPLTLSANQHYQIAILVHDQFMPTMSINEVSLMDIERYNQVSFRLSSTIIASLATMIVMGLFMLLLWWRIKDPTYGWYGLFSLATFLIWAINYEFLRTLFLSSKNFYLINYLAMAAMMFFSAQLTRTYLELKRFAPRIDRIYFWYGALTVLWMCLVAFVPFETSYVVSAILALLFLPILFSALYVTLRAGFRPARVYLVAWILYFSNGTLVALDGIGMNLSTATVRLLTVTSTAIGLTVMAYSVIQRIEQLRSEKHEAEVQARTDSLTGLANRAAYDFDCNLRKMEFQKGEIQDLTFTFIDLDGLKKINDTHGHHYGDQLLLAFSNSLKQVFRDHDHIYRLGGDEFVVVFIDDDNDELVDIISDRLTTVIYQLRKSGYPDADCSFGIAALSETNGSINKTMRLADERMYAKKKSKHTRAPEPVA